MEMQENGKTINVAVDVSNMKGSDQRKFLEVFTNSIKKPETALDYYDVVTEFLKKYTTIENPDDMTVINRNKVFSEIMKALTSVGFNKEDFTDGSSTSEKP